LSAANPLVSVVVPTHDRWPLLGQAIASVRAQSMGDLELIVCDDGSTDATSEEVRRIGDPRLRYEALPHSGNAGMARDRGVALARGKWVAFLDSDGLWHPRKLELQVAALRRSRALWSYAGHELIGDGGLSLRRCPAEDREWTSELVGELISDRASAAIGTLVIDRTVLKSIGGFSRTPVLYEDLDLVLRLAELFPAVSVADVLCGVRVPGARSGHAGADDDMRAANVYLAMLQRGFLAPDMRREARRVLAGHLTSSARHDLTRGRRSQARGKLTQCAWPGARSARWWWLMGRALLTG
jgi:glycosyltransferase involved in cell wall biosynthesis